MDATWLSHYDPHVQKNLSFPNVSVCDLLWNAAKQRPNAKALVWDDQFLTFRELLELSSRLAKGFSNLGFGPGSRIGVAFPNIPEFVITFFATLKTGAGVAAISPFLLPSEQIFQLQHIHADALIAEGSVIENIRTSDKKLPSSIQHVFSPKLQAYTRQNFLNFMKSSNKPGLASYWDDLFRYGIEEYSNVAKPDTPAIYQFTGGTTGVPKAAIGLHRNLVANTFQFKNWCDLDNHEPVILASIPLYHVYGMVLGMILAVASQAPLVLNKNPRDVSNLLKTIEKHSVTFFPGVPNLFSMINLNPDFRSGKFRLSSLKTCISGAAPLNTKIADTFEKISGCKLLQGYGLSEAPTATHCNPIYGLNKPNSIGMPLPGVNCRIVDIESGGRDVKPGESGELLINAPQVMSGYYENNEESAAVLQKGWLHTGDIVTIDEDGYFYFKERKKDLIKISGFQVWPNEIEEVLRNVNGILDVAVAGVTLEDSSELVIAWIVLSEDSEITDELIIEYCRNHLTTYKIPKKIIRIKEIPRTTTGKILRRILTKDYQKEKRTPR